MYQSILLSLNRRQCESYRWNKYVSRKIVWSICLIIPGNTCDGKFLAAKIRTSVTRHEGRAAHIWGCSLGRNTVEIHPQDRYGNREMFSENLKNG
jgi:hypothetical protein